MSSRRAFLKLGGGAAGATWLALHAPAIVKAADAAAGAQSAGADFEHIGRAEAEVLTAVSDQIFPPDERPGASDLGAVYFMDGALGGFMAGAAPMIKQGCAELNEAASSLSGLAFAELSNEQQTTLLQAREDTPFFGAVHFLTLCGVFAAPEHGGNREQLSWELMGFQPQHVWLPPFGHYDAAFHGEAFNDRS